MIRMFLRKDSALKFVDVMEGLRWNDRRPLLRAALPHGALAP
jgi:hypothetical protein